MLPNFHLYAQLTQRIITISQASMDMPKLAKAIATQTGLEYSLNMQNTSLKKTVQLKPGKWKLEDVMKEVKAQVGLNYKIIGDHILFTDYRPVAQQQLEKPKKLAEHLQAAPKPKVNKTAIDAPAPIGFTPYSLSPLSTSYAFAQQPDIKISRWQIVPPNKKDSGSKEEPKEKKERRHVELPGGWLSPYAEVGAQFNDLIYVNAVAKVGFQYIYGIASMGTSFSGGRFRYGAGICYPLNDVSSIRAEFTTGSLTRSPNPKDSARQQGPLKERANSYGISYTKAIRPRLTMQLELNFTTLKKTQDSTVGVPNAEHFYNEYGKTLYGFRDSGRFYELRSWVGIRVSLFYNLRRRR